MRVLAAIAAVASVASAQIIASIDVQTGPPMGVYKTANDQPAFTATTLAVVASATATAAAAVKKREVLPETNASPMEPAAINKRSSNVCVAQPSGISYVSSPDDPNTFLHDTYYSDASNNAVTPSGYTEVFSNIVAANSADNYMGFTTLTSYDVASCAANCDAISGCVSFNIYFERDPTLEPDPATCPNPPSLTRVKCVWWGGQVSLNNANNYGNLQANFYVVVAGSNGYVNTARAAGASATSTAAAAAATATAADGTVWQVYQQSDSSQGSFTNAQATSSYTDCMTICDNTSGCAAFSYVGGTAGVGSGTCWLKTQLGNPTTAGSGNVAAVRISSAAASTTAAASSSTTPSSTAAATTPLSSSAAAAVPAVSAAASSSSTSSWSLYRPVYVTTTSTTDAASTTPSSAPTTVAAPSSSSTTTVSTTTAASAAVVGKFGGGASSSSTNTTAVVSSTTSSTISITSIVPTTMATSTTTSSKIVTSTSTTSSAATSSTPFYLQVGTSNNGNNGYAYVNWFAGGTLQVVGSKALATQFYIDANGFWIEKNTFAILSGFKASVPQKGGAWQKLRFNALTYGSDPMGCQLTSGFLECNCATGFEFAGTCNNDGYIYFGAPNQISNRCQWTGLYPVSATNSNRWW